MTGLCGIELHSFNELQDIMQESDPIICVDSQKGAGNIQDLKGDEIACIDHHRFVEVEGLVFHDVRILGSCATLISIYYDELGVTPDPVTATALLFGLKMDTLNFTRGVQDEDIVVFRRLMNCCDRQLLSVLEHDTMEFKDLRAYGSAIRNIELYGRVGIAMIPFSCPDAVIATISDFMLSLDAVMVAVIYSKREDGIKFSARSEIPEEVNAAILLHDALKDYGDGGGHSFMAGGMIPSANIGKLGDDPDGTIRDLLLASAGTATEK